MENFTGAGLAAGMLACMSKSWARRAGTFFRSEVGDVPGWVLITLMTAGLVILIWGIAGPALGSVFQSALARVTGF